MEAYASILVFCFPAQNGEPTFHYHYHSQHTFGLDGITDFRKFLMLMVPLESSSLSWQGRTFYDLDLVQEDQSQEPNICLMEIIQLGLK